MIRFQIEFIADDRAALATALRSYAMRIEREEINGPNGCSGSIECGSTYHFDANWEPPPEYVEIKERLCGDGSLQAAADKDNDR